MALERKPLDANEKPDYPQSDEYASDRRAFLMMMGAAAVAASGAVILIEAGAGGRTSAPGSANPGGKTLGARPGLVTSQAAPLGEPLPVQPVPGQPAVCQPPKAQPLANIEGDVVAPVLPQPQARPVAPPPGEVQAVAPRVNIRGRIAAPRAAIKGKVAAPRWVKKTSKGTTKATPSVEEDF